MSASRNGNILGASHFGVTVADMDRSLRFYRDLLGLELTVDRVFEEEFVLDIVNVPTTDSLRIAILNIPGTETFLELLEYRGPEVHPASARPCDPGNGHLCLLVNDAAASYEQLRAAGVRVRSEPIPISAGPTAGSRCFYAMDPDGYHVEFFEAADAVQS